ncbi:hypothetical protein IG631_13930 [Alternaria alternata]|nr:hypothetical protein IG631_13930 [Alternaria alternata]
MLDCNYDTSPFTNEARSRRALDVFVNGLIHSRIEGSNSSPCCGEAKRQGLLHQEATNTKSIEPDLRATARVKSARPRNGSSWSGPWKPKVGTLRTYKSSRKVRSSCSQATLDTDLPSLDRYFAYRTPIAALL